MLYYQGLILIPVTTYNIIGQLVGNLTSHIDTLLSCGFYFFDKYQSSSETIREDPNVRRVSDHLGNFRRYKINSEFGYYLAGQIEGNGDFSSQNQLVICFHKEDVSLAFYIKKQIGYGRVSRIKDKNGVKYVISSKSGITKVISLINGKMRTKEKYTQQENLVASYYSIGEIILQPLDSTPQVSNPWQAGFIDADGSFQIKLIDRAGRNNLEVRQAQQIDQKTKDILQVIKKEFGGSIGYRLKQDTFYYSSVNFGVARRFINYFQTYNIQSYKYVNYIKWRKVYVMVSKKEHLTIEGLNRIKKYKG